MVSARAPPRCRRTGRTTSIHAATLETLHGETATLEGVEIHAGIDDLMSVVNVRQHYRNRGRKHIEAVYGFPLPLEGVLPGFQVELDDRRLSGTVVERFAAARRYEDAVTDGDAAVLLEQPQPGLYAASVGNLAPGETASVRFRYGLLLRWNADRVGLVIPMTIAPRYGDPASGGLAPHQEPVYGVGAGPAFSVRVAVRGVLRQAFWTSPSHDVAITPRSRGRAPPATASSRSASAAPSPSPSSEEGDDRQAATPADLVARLNEWPMPPMPPFDDLAAWFPDEVREGLAALVDGGRDAESVVNVMQLTGACSRNPDFMPASAMDGAGRLVRVPPVGSFSPSGRASGRRPFRVTPASRPGGPGRAALRRTAR